MAEREAPLLVLAADAGNNGSIRLLWRGCRGGSARCLFWQRAGPEGRGILRTPAPTAGREDTAGAVGHGMAAGAAPACGSPWGCSPHCLPPALGLGVGSPSWGGDPIFPPIPAAPGRGGSAPACRAPHTAKARGTSPSRCVPAPRPLLTPPAPGPGPSSHPLGHRPGLSGPKSGHCRGGGRAGPAGGRGPSLGNSLTTATGPTGRTSLW